MTPTAPTVDKLDPEANGYTFEWLNDDDADLSWASDEERATFREVLGCVCIFPSGQRGPSLWGIVDPDRAYMREIERELYLEALAEIETSLGGA